MVFECNKTLKQDTVEVNLKCSCDTNYDGHRERISIHFISCPYFGQTVQLC